MSRIFQFLCTSEFTVPTQVHYDHITHLSFGDVIIDNKDPPQLLRVWIKQCKTDLFRQEVDSYLGQTDENICPIRGIIPHLAHCGGHPGPLFILGLKGIPFWKKHDLL